MFIDLKSIYLIKSLKKLKEIQKNISIIQRKIIYKICYISIRRWSENERNKYCMIDF